MTKNEEKKAPIKIGAHCIKKLFKTYSALNQQFGLRPVVSPEAL
jgi:hypothetical protein